ncbi:MAG: phosphosulfolactate synthase [Nitrospinota bacterium]
MMDRNEPSDRLEGKAFDFIQIPPRSIKPRERGLTIVADKGLSVRGLEDLIEVAGEYIDWLKIGISAPRIWTREFLRRKIDVCHQSDIRVFFAGDFSEMAFHQGVHNQYYDEAKSLGADGVEVSTSQLSLPLDDKILLVREASSRGLLVIAEVGKKGVDDLRLHAGYLRKEMSSLMDAGAWKILVQAEGLAENVDRINETVYFDVAAAMDLKDLIFQAKDSRAHFWFLSQFGSEVSLDIEVNQVVQIELSRRGLRSRGLFQLMASVKPGR